MKLRHIIIFCIFLITSQIAYADLNENGDFHFSNSDSLIFPLSKLVTLIAKAQFRWGDNASFLFDKYYYLEYRFKPLKWLHLGAAYRQIYSRIPGGSWKTTYDPYFQVFFKGNLSKFEIENRNRFQYYYAHWRTPTWVYRNRTTIGAPIKLTHNEITPYISDELFFEKNRGFVENRINSGCLFSIINPIQSDIYFSLRNIKRSTGWIHITQLGVDFSYSF